MNIPASYLFSEKKFESFKDYLELSAIQDDWQYDIVNDIGYKGKIFEDATLQKGGIPTESKDLASCDLIVQMNKSFNKVYLPGVRYVQFSTVFKPLNIGEIYIQPNSSVKAMTLSAYGGSIDVKSLHMQAVPRILISNIVVEELHLQSKERTLTYLRCSKGGEYYNISKISADSKVIVYQKGNNTILAQDINDRISKESIESAEKTKEEVLNASTISGEKFSIAEYYDLPYRYNQTIVKLLYQTPTTLFIYWDISNEDRENLKKTYGEDFFEKTKPVLIVYNETKGYSFEVEINDFANCWYLKVNDSKCKYKIELGRKPFEVTYNGEVTEVKTTPKITEHYIPITSSNEIEAPNDHVLFEQKQEMIYFKNVKNNAITAKNIATLNFVKSIGKVYQFNDFYKKFYKNENLDSFDNVKNPSSNSLSSSRFK